MWVGEALADSEQYQRCLDLACGDMQIYPQIRSATYVGVDADSDRLARAAAQYPTAVAVASRIEQIGDDTTGDLVICIQTIGFNADFNLDNTLIAVQKCIAATQPNGKLIINVGFRASDYQSGAEKMLQGSFADVEARHYGAFKGSLSKICGRRLAFRLSWLIAFAMKIGPALRVSRKSPNILFVCENRNIAG